MIQTSALLQTILDELAICSRLQHELATRKALLVDARTRLRLGVGADVVLAQIGEHSPELLERVTAA